MVCRVPLEQERPPLWMKYIEYLIYQRQCATRRYD